MIGYAFSFLQPTTLSTAEWVLLGELALLGFAVAMLLVSLRFVWRQLRPIMPPMAGPLSWAIAIAAIVFLIVRLVRFHG